MTQTSAKPKNVRKNNFILLLNLYRQNPSLSVTKIAQIASLSRTTGSIEDLSPFYSNG